MGFFLCYLFVCYCFLQNKTIRYRTRNKNGFKENVYRWRCLNTVKNTRAIKLYSTRSEEQAHGECCSKKYITTYSINDRQKNKGAKTYFLLSNRSDRLFLLFPVFPPFTILFTIIRVQHRRFDRNTRVFGHTGRRPASLLPILLPSVHCYSGVFFQ